MILVSSDVGKDKTRQTCLNQIHEFLNKIRGIFFIEKLLAAHSANQLRKN